jgi:peptidyl-prolyl cis-trans isomerase C
MVQVKTWILVVLMAGCAGCTGKKDGGEDKPKEQTQPADRMETPEVTDLGDALAMINGIPISREEFLLYIQPYPDRMKENLQGREYVINALTDQILLEGEARRLGLDKDPDYRRKVDSYRRNLLNNQLFETTNKGEFSVTPEEAQAYFQAHPEEFDRPEKVQARHILVATEKEAQDLLKKIKKGANFEQLAKQHSLDPSTRDRGGDLGPFSRDQRPELAAAAFSISKPGGVAGPVKTGRGFHLLQMVQHFPAKKETFEQVRDGLLSRLRARKRQETKQELLAKLRQQAQIQIDKQALESLQITMGGK